MNNRKSLIAAIVTGAAVFVIFGSITLKNPPKEPSAAPKYQFVVAKADIKKDAKITEDDVEIKDFPVNIDGTFKGTGEVIGRDAKMDITAGKPIIKNFVKEINIKKENPMGEEPRKGYRAIPILMKKSALPPYLSIEAKFDLTSGDNTVLIENLRILNILDPTKDESNKMLILEIKEGDIKEFVKYVQETKSLVFLQKNPSEYGEYKYHSAQREAAKAIAASNGGSIPPLGSIPDIENLTGSGNIPHREVEVIVGSSKSKVEFAN